MALLTTWDGDCPRRRPLAKFMIIEWFDVRSCKVWILRSVPGTSRKP